jgi:hypothetical protein
LIALIFTLFDLFRTTSVNFVVARAVADRFAFARGNLFPNEILLQAAKRLSADAIFDM